MINSILHWNQVSLEATKADFSTTDPSLKPEQGGPTRTSRALAMVHLAMYDAYVGIKGGGQKYLTYATSETPGTNDLQAAQAAVAAAACLMLISLYSRQRETFLKEHEKFVAMLPDHDPKIAKGLAWGTVAEKMLAARVNDGSSVPDTFYAPSTEPGRHRVDPMNPGQGFLGPLWGKVKPFGISNLTTTITPADPPALNSQKYADDFNEVLQKGIDQGGTRTPGETTVGLFWAYDGVFNIGVPPRLYNQAVRAIAKTHGTNEAQDAKLFAMVNIAMADAGIYAWYEKYKYNFWRPVLGIREANAGWGPTGVGDGNAGTAGDPYWQPLGSPRTNQPSHSPFAFTPGFPAYPSGHATFGTAALRVTELALGLPNTFEFKFVSDELDGSAVGATGIRMRYENTLTIAEAIKDNLESRVFLGVHWRFDGDEGKRVGNEIATLINGAFPALA